MSYGFSSAHMIFLPLTWVFWALWHGLLSCRGISLLSVRLSIPGRWTASESCHSVQGHAGHTSPMCWSCFSLLCACVVAAGKRGPGNAYHLAALNCMPCTFARSEHTEAQSLSFPCFSHIKTLMKKQIRLGFDLLILKYSKQRTNHLFLPGTIFPAHLGRSPAGPQPQWLFRDIVIFSLDGNFSDVFL